jgi:hypothetical protein
MTYHRTVLEHWDHFAQIVNDPITYKALINGKSLRLADVVAFARYILRLCKNTNAYLISYTGQVQLSDTCLIRVEESAGFLAERISTGDITYGTGTEYQNISTNFV